MQNFLFQMPQWTTKITKVLVPLRAIWNLGPKTPMGNRVNCTSVFYLLNQFGLFCSDLYIIDSSVQTWQYEILGPRAKSALKVIQSFSNFAFHRVISKGSCPQNLRKIGEVRYFGSTFSVEWPQSSTLYIYYIYNI